MSISALSYGTVGTENINMPEPSLLVPPTQLLLDCGTLTRRGFKLYQEDES